eukprot:5087258-Pleurochrysis_carterae.AAC.4
MQSWQFAASYVTTAHNAQGCYSATVIPAKLPADDHVSCKKYSLFIKQIGVTCLRSELMCHHRACIKPPIPATW